MDFILITDVHISVKFDTKSITREEYFHGKKEEED